MRMAAYCRVSTDKDEQLTSLENQREFFEQYAKKEGDTLVEIYADEGISGKSMNKRDAFLKLLKDAENNMFDYVAVKDISRFARNTSDFLYGIRTLRANGVDVRFLSNNQTVIGESEFVLTVFAALAQEESANLSKRVIFGKKQNAKKGRVPNIVYGYNKIDTYTLEINEQESYIVKLMFKWYIEGDGTRRIAIKLNEMGIPTKKQAKWTPKTVRRILQNPVYMGKLINNKSVTKDFLSGTRTDLPEEEWYVHIRPELSIVSSTDFNKAQEIMEQRRGQFQAVSKRYSNSYLFSNIIKCSECGRSFTARVYQWKNTYVRYRCCNHNNGSVYCTNNVTIDEQELLDKIKEYLICEIGNREVILEKTEPPRNMSHLKEAKRKLEKRRDKFKEMYVAGAVGIEELKDELRHIDSGIQSIDDEMSEKQEQSAVTSIPASEIIKECEFTNNDMREMIDKIVVHPDKLVEVFIK